MRSWVVANHGELNNKERNKESTARGGMTKMVRLFRTKKLKLELLNPRTATTFSTPRTAKRCHLTPAYIYMSKTYDNRLL